MLDLNNRPGGPNLIVTAKTAHKVHFLDAATLTTSVTLDMPGSTHEIALSVDGRTAYATIYGDGIFGKNVNPDRRIAVIDLPSKSLARTIDLGGVFAPHGVMIDADDVVWCTGELGQSVFALDPKTGAADRIEIGTAHWLAISHKYDKVFVSIKRNELVVIDRTRRAVIDRIKLPQIIEGLAVAPAGETIFACAQTAAEFYAVDAQSHALRRTIAIEGANGTVKQMRRVRVSPDNKYVVVASHMDGHAAIYDAANLKLLATFPTKKAPMGFGFAADGRHGFLCCHDDAVVYEFELASGRITRSFTTAAGCEFIVAYH